jgi:hypothetical protein
MVLTGGDAEHGFQVGALDLHRGAQIAQHESDGAGRFGAKREGVDEHRRADDCAARPRLGGGDDVG